MTIDELVGITPKYFEHDETTIYLYTTDDKKYSMEYDGWGRTWIDFDESIQGAVWSPITNVLIEEGYGGDLADIRITLVTERDSYYLRWSGYIVEHVFPKLIIKNMEDYEDMEDYG